MKPSIYAIKNNINNKIYIGSTNNPKRRWGDHRSRLKNGYHENPYLQRAWNKYGEDNFSFEVLEETTVDMLIEREQYFMDKFVSYKEAYGYNNTKVAGRPPSWTGRKLTEEHKEKIRQANAGHFVSKETKRKISEAVKGRKLSEEHKEKIRKYRLGKPGIKHTNETKDKIRRSLLGSKLSEETKKKISEANKGRVSPTKGTKASKKTKQKMSIAQKEAWKKRKEKSYGNPRGA